MTPWRLGKGNSSLRSHEPLENANPLEDPGFRGLQTSSSSVNSRTISTFEPTSYVNSRMVSTSKKHKNREISLSSLPDSTKLNASASPLGRRSFLEDPALEKPRDLSPSKRQESRLLRVHRVEGASELEDPRVRSRSKLFASTGSKRACSCISMHGSR